jgi:hypothetical protein
MIISPDSSARKRESSNFQAFHKAKTLDSCFRTLLSGEKLGSKEKSVARPGL